MIGRAGRAGKAEKGDSILMCDKKDLVKVEKMLISKIDDTVSVFIKDTTYIKTLILNLIGTKLCKNFDDIHDSSKCMLSRVQQNKFGVNMKKIFVETLKNLLNEGVVIKKSQYTKSNGLLTLSYNLRGTGTNLYGTDFLLVNKLLR